MPSNNNHLAPAVELLCQAREQQRPLSLSQLAAVRGPATEEEAYWIQEAVLARLAAGRQQRVSAWKVGAPSREATPIAAPIADALVHPDGARLEGAGFYVIGIEAELAYRFCRDFPARSEAYTPEEVWEGIDGVCAAIEIVDTRLERWDEAGPWWKLADNQVNGGLVLGSGIDDWQGVDNSRQAAEQWLNGKRVIARTGSHPLGDPLCLIPWLVNHCTGRQGGLRAGDHVTTGTWTGMEFVPPGSSVRVCFPGVGEVSVEL
ncbi:2-keto-4-pentenoate hydratase [Aestuariirhabdus litorea]|nr:fumarylacetoacetate hydrolase family protein [Aestuariirhabdus litorea]